MNRHMVKETGTQFFELASSLGRIHADTLSSMANAASTTPLGPVFAMNASLARLANEGMDTMASRLATAKAAAPKAKPKKAKAPAKPKAAKPAKAKAPAPVATLADTMEPDVADVMVEADAIAPATTNDDLAKINGIGATTVKKLNGVGISSLPRRVHRQRPPPPRRAATRRVAPAPSIRPRPHRAAPPSRRRR